MIKLVEVVVRATGPQTPEQVGFVEDMLRSTWAELRQRGTQIDRVGQFLYGAAAEVVGALSQDQLQRAAAQLRRRNSNRYVNRTDTAVVRAYLYDYLDTSRHSFSLASDATVAAALMPLQVGQARQPYGPPAPLKPPTRPLPA